MSSRGVRFNFFTRMGLCRRVRAPTPWRADYQAKSRRFAWMRWAKIRAPFLSYASMTTATTTTMRWTDVDAIYTCIYM